MTHTDTEPVDYFRAVASRHRRCFWLDGRGGRAWSGRRSLIGWLDEDGVSLSYDAARGEVSRHTGFSSTVVGTDVFAVLQEEMQPDDQWFGYFGHASRADLPARTGTGLPDAVWMRASQTRTFEHGPTPTEGNPPRAAGADGAVPAPPWYRSAFACTQEHLHAGDSYEVNLTYRVELASTLDPVTAYLRLRHLNPAPYAGFLQHDVPGARAWLLSSSPERFATVNAEGVIETKPIKGTTARGATPDEDERLRRHLQDDPKTRAENLMIVDLLRNDLSMVCEPGSVQVPALMEVESYESVHQLVSTARGRLRPEVSTIEAVRALFPPGSMTGAPKLRTMQIIDSVETTPRGPYAGGFGWIGGNGDADLGVIIRSLFTAGDGHWAFGTGGGITVRSDVEDEWEESRWKADKLLAVFD